MKNATPLYYNCKGNHFFIYIIFMTKMTFQTNKVTDIINKSEFN